MAVKKYPMETDLIDTREWKSSVLADSIISRIKDVFRKLLGE